MNDIVAIIHSNIAKRTHRQYPVRKIEAFAFESAMDNDADEFSIDIGDPENDYRQLLGRDTEVKIALYLSARKAGTLPVFTGFADTVVKDSDDKTLSITGRDVSSLALTDAAPGKIRHLLPKPHIEKRARTLGFTRTRIHKMSQIGTFVSDGSETEWAQWYRMVRHKGFWMWTEPDGTLVVDHLNYSPTHFSYMIGTPLKGTNPANWMLPIRVRETKSTAGRLGDVWVYGQNAKTAAVFAAHRADRTITSWQRRPRKIIQSSTAKSNALALKEADLEVFESIVGSYEIEITLHYDGKLVRQNRMARVHIPELELNGTYYVVASRLAGSGEGMTQVVRLRQRQYALSKRDPQDPKVGPGDPGINATTASIGAALGRLAGESGVRWADSFVRAAREFGQANGWDLAVFLGVLLSMCEAETHFSNVREGGMGIEWTTRDAWLSSRETAMGRTAALRLYEETFANRAGNPDNPYGREAGVGPMQLTSTGYKTWADEYGWNGRKDTHELTGGRWNPDSNIRAAARALIEKLNVPPAANPNDSNSIWLGVARYNGSTAYANRVKRIYTSQFQALAESAVGTAAKVAPGTTATVDVPGHGKIEPPYYTPASVRKAVNFCIRRLGDRYEYGGYGPYYDCSSLVTAAYAAASPLLRAELDEPGPGRHGETTYTLFRRGRFPSVAKDKLLMGDLVFFIHPGANEPEHVGMYLGEGLFIHDPKPGDVVKISALGEGWYSENYQGARRLVQWYIPGVTDFPS